MISPERRLWRGRATSVTAPAANGYVGILPEHQPMLASLKAGTVTVRQVSGEALTYDVESGVLSVDQDVVMVLVDAARAEAGAE